jgi:hypothetical protein
VAVHKRLHKTQIYPGRDKCGKRNCLILQTIEKCVRERQETGVTITRAALKMLAGGPRKP